jgi:hypothetical protein
MILSRDPDIGGLAPDIGQRKTGQVLRKIESRVRYVNCTGEARNDGDRAAWPS